MSTGPVSSPPPAPRVNLAPCNRKGCPKFASRALCMLVPHIGKRHNDPHFEAMQLFLGFELCHTHASQAKVADFIKPDFETAIRTAVIPTGKPAPDFTRAIIELDRAR